jgi:OOP family OmpA-OmpF porin
MTRDPKSIERQGAQRRCSNGRGSAPSTLSTSWGRRLASLAVAMSVGASATLFARETSAANCAPSAPGYGGFSTCFDSNNLWLRPGSSPFVSVGPSTTVAEDKLSFGLGLTYLSRPVGVGVASADPDGSVRTLVDNVVDATFLFGVGLTDRLELTLAAPVTLFQDGAGIGGLTGDGTELTRSVVRDFRFGLAYAVVARPRVGPDEGFALVLRNEFAAPTGDPRSFASSQGVVMRPSAVASYRTGRLELALEGGARLRRDADFAGARIGSQVEAALGAALDVVRDRKLTLGAEAFGLFTVAEQKRADGAAAPMLAPIEWMATLSSAPILGGDLSFQLHGGGPIPTQGGDDGPDGGLTTGVTSPRFRFGAAVRYAPTGRDSDGDGVLDRDDACPTVREDRDGFEDADGCPEADNDKDGIPDEKDRCRNEPETFDGFQDEDGCPDPDDDGDGILDGDDQCRRRGGLRRLRRHRRLPRLDNDEDGIPDDRKTCARAAPKTKTATRRRRLPRPRQRRRSHPRRRRSVPSAGRRQGRLRRHRRLPRSRQRRRRSARRKRRLPQPARDARR